MHETLEFSKHLRLEGASLQHLMKWAQIHWSWLGASVIISATVHLKRRSVVIFFAGFKFANVEESYTTNKSCLFFFFLRNAEFLP